VDDLVDRVEAIVSSSAQTDADPEAESETVYEGESDTELFDIFMEQLVGGIDQLVETAGQMARGEAVGQSVEEMAGQVDRLASTSSYMGYDALSSVYDDMAAGIGAFTSQAATGADDVDNFLQSVIVSGIRRIQDLFPNARKLQQIDPGALLQVADDDAAPMETHNRTNEDARSLDDDPGIDRELSLDLDPDVSASGTPITPETDTSLLADFADETREHLDELENSLLRLESDPADQELLNTIFRSMHTIKGASEYLGFERIARLSHRLENLLDLFRDGSLRVDKVAVDLLIDAGDRIGELTLQVEASGQERADVDDLVDRVEAIVSSSAQTDADPEAESETVYEGESDTELFDIFMEQLVGGIDQLVETAGQMARGEAVGQSVEEMAGQVDRLASTSSYMGYDALSSVYDDMAAGIGAFTSQAATGADDVDNFLQSVIVSGIRRIQDLFPNEKRLATIDTMAFTVQVSDSVLPDRTPEASPPPSSEIARLLAGLPVINEDERESLLSKTLDETFASMHIGGGDAEAFGGTQNDMDPIARQFSSETDAADFQSPGPAMPGVGDDESLTILDDFGSDRNPSTKDAPAGFEEKGHAWLPADGKEEVALWPEAEETSAPVPEAPVPDPEPTMPVVDFSSPPAPEPEVPNETETESFSARRSIRKSIRVDANKVDELMNQVGELVVNRSSFSQLFNEMRGLTQYLSHRFSMDKADQRLVSGLTARLNDATTVLGRVTSELQEQVMKVRMLPISRLFNRYPRLVHDLLKDSNKKIQLQFRGEETELDRMVIEQLADPMIHIIRNAVDHGIEMGDDRMRKGKPESGALLLEAYHEGSNVIIEVTDDGKGIDLSRIREKAVEKQLADRETLDRMDQQALIDMILLPGFSTADQITHTSGRGVGMDVVKRNIEKINGTLVVDTRQDIGTRFRIKIPLTLAIIPALMIRCGGSHFTVPLSAVQETLRIDRGEIFTVDGSEVIHLHEAPLSLVRLTDLLNMQDSPRPASDERLFVVVVKTAAGRTGFIVDELLGRQEVVIKPLEDYLQEHSGFCGATILGDGGISLILNVDELAAMAKQREAEKKLAVAVL
jgi:two-component system chemotaxis sensor kinase CheA